MTDHKRARSTFIIATRNRPEELLTTVGSLVAQTLLPKDLCIVDSSDETPVRAKIEELCAGVGLPLDYHHPAPRGLTVQRNFGITRTDGDPVFFIDDDVFLAPDCHEAILAEYERWGSELGGVRATPVHPARPPLVSVAWRKLFGIGGWWPEASGRMRPGFWVEGVSEAAGVRKVEYMTGWFMSFRRTVVDEFRFDEALSGYGHKEDVDFTYRVSRRYVLLQTPAARCEHFQTVTSRLSSHQLMRMNLGNQFYLHRKNMPQDGRHIAALWWGLVGLFVLNVGRALFKRDPGLVTGMIVGAFEQARGRGLIDPASGALPAMTAADTGGAKKRDYPWTVLVVDPLAFPLVRLLERKRWLTPDQVTYVSLLLGLAVGPLFALGNRGGLIAGAILYYLSFVFDCVDGKLARLLGINSPRGQELDALADGARRGSAVIGLGFYLWRTGEPATTLLWLLAFGILAFYFMEISGAEKRTAADGRGGRWSQALARRRLLPTPGMPDVSAIVFVIGPLVGAILPTLYVGIVMVAFGILLTSRRRLRVKD